VNYVVEKLKKSKGKQVMSELIGNMFDDIVAKDIATSNGLGTDNLTCIVIEFKK
jgi:hypothetical protein